MILHLVTKHRVSNGHLAIFEKKKPGQNIVLIIDAMPGGPESIKNGIEVSDNNIKEIVSSINFNSIKQVVIHYLTPKISYFVHNYVPEGIPIYWWTYGGDLYHPFLERRGYDLFYTDLKPFKPGWSYMVYRFLRTHCDRILYRAGLLFSDKYMQTSFLDRLEGIIPCITPDYSLACTILKKDYKDISIYQGGWKPCEEDFLNEDVVAIGHSASYTDNHIYALKYLSSININKTNLSLTLSYNINSYKYINMVKKRYKKRYGENVSFVEEIMSKEEWLYSQAKLKILILPTWRQEALANVYSAFMRGVKLFLSKKGPMYKYFLGHGFIVFPLEDMNQSMFDMSLTLEEKLYNRNLMIHYVEEGKRIAEKNFELYFCE